MQPTFPHATSVHARIGKTDRGWRRRGTRGDTVVVQLRSATGQSKSTRATLVSIGLGGIDDVSFGFSSDPSFMGQAKKVEHLVEVFPLTGESMREIKRKHLRTSRDSDRAMSIKSYPVAGLTGRILTLGNGEYIQCEQGKQFLGLAWSSGLPLETLLLLISNRVEFERGVVVLNGDEEFEGSSSKAVMHALERSQDIEFLRLDATAVAFSWLANAGTSRLKKVRLHECGLIVTSADFELMEAIVADSATEGIGGAGGLLRNYFSDLVSPYDDPIS